MRHRSFLSSRVRSREPQVVLPMVATVLVQHGNRLARTLRHEQCARQIEIVTMRGKRIDPHRSFDPRYGRLGIATERRIDPALHDKTWVVGIERPRSLQVVLAFSKLSP